MFDSFYANEINPFTEAWIQYMGYGQITQINNLVLVQAANQNQSEVTDAKTFLSDARAQIQAMRSGVTTAEQPGQLERMEAAAQALSISAQLDPAVPSDTKADLAQLVSDLGALHTARDQGTLSEQQDRLDQTDQRLARLEAVADLLKSIPPEVLVQPLVQDYKNIAPVSVFQMLGGKYLGYLLFLGAIVAALTALLVYGLGVPFQGDVRLFALEIFLLVMASLGIGFTISAISSTDTQAVQFSMLMLLGSIFFSGFSLPLDSFRIGVQYLAAILPLTHGSLVLQEEMLLGHLFHPYSILALAVIAGVTFLTALYFTKRQFKRL
jgi:ABC-2 type transport system permease protein